MPRLLVAVLAGVVLLLPHDADAGAPTDAMKDFFGAVNVVLKDPTTEDQPMERLRAIRRHVDDVFDFREASMLALGREWSARTPLEQNEFVALFADLLERSFVWRVAGKATTAGGVKVSYLSESVDGDTATVETQMAARDGNELRLDFRMVRRAERWVVRDVVMDGVSTMDNYHAQFQRLTRDGSWSDVVGQLRAKLGTPAGTVQVATATPPMMWPSELRAPTRVSEPMVAVPVPPVPSSIARPLETAVVSARPAVNGAAPAPATPASAPEPATLADRALAPSREGQTPAPRAIAQARATSPPPTGEVAATPPVTEPVASPAREVTATPSRETTPARGTTSTRARETTATPVREAATRPPATPAREVALATPGPGRSDPPRVEPPPVMSRGVIAPAPDAPSYWIQVGAYRSATAAGRVAAQVRGEILVVATPADAHSPLLRVRVGPFADRARAVARLAELQAQGWRAFIAEGH